MSIESRLKAMEAIVAELDAANAAANDRNAPIRFGGRGAEGFLDTFINHSRRIDMFDPQTELPQRQKHFFGMFFAWEFLRQAREKEPNFTERVSEEKQQEFLETFVRYAQRLFDVREWVKGFMTSDGKLDTAKLLPHRDYCPVVV